MKIGDTAAFATFLPRPDETKVGDTAEALEDVEMDVEFRSSDDEDDDEVDMIPLIDISLVLLIYFMMTATVSAEAHKVTLPESRNSF